MSELAAVPDPPVRPDPRRVVTADDLVRELDLLRIRAAVGFRRTRVGLEEIAKRTAIPRSTAHAYLSGRRLPPADSLDELVIALGASPAEQREWAEALYRVVADSAAERATRPPAAAPGEPAPRVPRVPRQLPARPRMLVGREAELAQLDTLFDGRGDAAGALVLALSGTGGVGKTALALSWAHRVAERFPDGQLWLDLRGFSARAPLTPADALERLLLGLGLGSSELPADLESLSALFRSVVAGRTMLLVLDNAVDSAQVLPLLPGTDECVTVVTSRNLLRSLSALGVAENIALEPLAADAAEELIAHRLPDATGEDAELVRRISAECGGLPLALRIVGERLRRSSRAEAHDFAADLDRDHRTRLAALDVGDPAGDVSVRGALRWSYEALPVDAATLFRRLPLCHHASFEVPSAAAVLDAEEDRTRELLEQLVGVSLLDADARDRYRIHDLVLDYARVCLERDEPAEAVSAARVRTMRLLVDETQAAMTRWNPELPMRLDRPEAWESQRAARPPAEWTLDQPDLFAAAIVDAVEHGLDPYAWALAERTCRLAGTRNDYGTLLPAVQVALESARAAGDARASAVLSRQLGILNASSGRLDSAQRYFEQAIEACRQGGLREWELVDRSNVAIVAAMRGDAVGARSAMIDNIEERTAASVLSSAALCSLADVERELGDLDAARHSVDRAVAMLDADLIGVNGLEARLCRARIAVADGESTPLRDLDVVEQEARSVRQWGLVAQALLVGAEQSLLAGDLAATEQAARSGLALANQLGERAERSSALRLLAEVAAAAADPGAVSTAQQALTPAVECGRQHPLVQCLLTLARCRFAAGEARAARSDAERARELARASSYRLLEAQAEDLLRVSGEEVQQ